VLTSAGERLNFWECSWLTLLLFLASASAHAPAHERFQIFGTVGFETDWLENFFATQILFKFLLISTISNKVQKEETLLRHHSIMEFTTFSRQLLKFQLFWLSNQNSLFRQVEASNWTKRSFKIDGLPIRIRPAWK
jgi:hypothetical protein